MRIAAISDIHGNIDALEAVLADIERRDVDVTVNLGDIVSGPLMPVETADRLIPLALPTIRGNHERQLLATPLDQMGQSDRYARDVLADKHLAWLSSLPASIRLTPDILVIHGGIDSDLTYLLERVTPEGRRAATAAEVASSIENVDASLIICGHTHVPRSVMLADGHHVVNPGSVGLQAYADVHPYPHTIENGSPHARYAIVEQTGTRWNVEFFEIEYDWERAATLAEQRGRADWAHALRSGRA